MEVRRHRPIPTPLREHLLALGVAPLLGEDPRREQEGLVVEAAPLADRALEVGERFRLLIETVTDGRELHEPRAIIRPEAVGLEQLLLGFLVVPLPGQGRTAAEMTRRLDCRVLLGPGARR